MEEESKGQSGNVWWYNFSYNEETGEGSYLYKMDPGTKSKTHLHMGPEEFFLLEGDLTDSDGFEYKKVILCILDQGPVIIVPPLWDVKLL